MPLLQTLTDEEREKFELFLVKCHSFRKGKKQKSKSIVYGNSVDVFRAKRKHREALALNQGSEKKGKLGLSTVQGNQAGSARRKAEVKQEAVGKAIVQEITEGEEEHEGERKHETIAKGTLGSAAVEDGKAEPVMKQVGSARGTVDGPPQKAASTHQQNETAQAEETGSGRAKQPTFNPECSGGQGSGFKVMRAEQDAGEAERPERAEKGDTPQRTEGKENGNQTAVNETPKSHPTGPSTDVAKSLNKHKSIRKRPHVANKNIPTDKSGQKRKVEETQQDKRVEGIFPPGSTRQKRSCTLVHGGKCPSALLVQWAHTRMRCVESSNIRP
ncbi:hypothetical protein cyc_03864 [Cyclospora cayetanensis]|uniref:Uncharacterized protein n=1 Tax=Cyclospora cayetanensis TaxID=88456 RepID=A0A1D3CVD4_9EIME|nr:hypothetical protein cyc_03864 [Cyclospora cayetanensis]